MSVNKTTMKKIIVIGSASIGRTILSELPKVTIQGSIEQDRGLIITRLPEYDISDISLIVKNKSKYHK